MTLNIHLDRAATHQNTPELGTESQKTLLVGGFRAILSDIHLLATPIMCSMIAVKSIITTQKGWHTAKHSLEQTHKMHKNVPLQAGNQKNHAPAMALKQKTYKNKFPAMLPAVCGVIITLLCGCSQPPMLKLELSQHNSNNIIIFIHGFTSNNEIWPQGGMRDISTKLNADAYYFSYDSRAIDVANQSKTTEAVARALVQSVTKQNLDNKRITFVGHSQGAIIALRTLIMMPHAQIDRIILLGPPLFGSTSIPPTWALPTPSNQLVELTEYSSALLDLNLSLRDHLSTRENQPFIANLISVSDEYVPSYSAFVNFGRHKNIPTTLAHSDLTTSLSKSDLLDELTSNNTQTSHIAYENEIMNTLIIKADELIGMQYIYREEAVLEPPDSRLEALGYTHYKTMGSDRASKNKILDFTRSPSQIDLNMNNISLGKVVSTKAGSDGKIVSRTEEDIPRPTYPGIGYMPTRCQDRSDRVTAIWTKTRNDGVFSERNNNRIRDRLLPCLSDTEIYSYMRAIGYDVLFQNRKLLRSSTGSVIKKKEIPIGRVLARQFTSDHTLRRSCSDSRRITYNAVDGSLKPVSNLTDSEKRTISNMTNNGGAPPPPFYFSRCNTANSRSLYGSVYGDYIIIHNVRPGSYTIDLLRAIAPYQNGTEGDELEEETVKRVKKLTATSYDITVFKGTTVLRLGENPTESPSPTEIIALHQKANSGVSDAQFTLAYMYYKGRGVPQDYAQAVDLFRKSADQGDATAGYNLGVMYEYGEGVAKDYAQAAIAFRRAADRGFIPAQTALGLAYYQGRGVAQDYTQAAVRLQIAADRGDAIAQYQIGIMYYLGKGMPKDHAKAAIWLKKASDQGDQDAYDILDHIYDEGDVLPND